MSRTKDTPTPTEDAWLADWKDQSVPVSEWETRLRTSPDGLTTEDAQRRLARYGPNEIPEVKTSALRKFLSYFWGPIPWMIEAAAVLSILDERFVDFTIVIILLVFNATVGFWQDHQASNALATLRKQLALKARVRRSGTWSLVDAQELVPGDAIRIRLGDIIPADAVLVDGDYLSVDQSALTGESLPVDKKVDDAVYSGSIARQGEMIAFVVATGMNTFFGKTAKLVATAHPISHFQKAVLAIGKYLILLSVALAAILTIVELLRGEPVLTLLQFALILTVASIPAAMPAVLSVTMAVGALLLSKLKAIVTHLESIEEMAGIDTLCADKTGTLTQNRIALGSPVAFGPYASSDVIVMAALASKSENRDAIDLAVLQGVPDPEELRRYRQTAFVPFDPVHKRTEATIQGPDGGSFQVAKGAPQVILDLCQPDPGLRAKAEAEVTTSAKRGFRTLGVARRLGGGPWEFCGILPLFDPPREDSEKTIEDARNLGISVKMVTGDNVAIAEEMAHRLGLGARIEPADRVFRAGHPVDRIGEEVEAAEGFAQVFPEHKYLIVNALQKRGHIVGMTGDGVNDAPALKQAEVGVAVSDATDAARAAADLVLTAPGLSVIIRAVEEARRIFQRMTTYAIYRISETVRIMVFVVLAVLAFDFFPITAILFILLAFFNDVPILAIAYDRTWLDPRPVRWRMRRVIGVASVMGTVGVIGSMLMLILARYVLQLDVLEIQTFIFLKMAVSGHLMLFVARTEGPLWRKPHPAPILTWTTIGTKVAASFFVAFGFGIVAPISALTIGIVWAYALGWMFVADWAKRLAYRRIDRGELPGVPVPAASP